MRILSTFQGDQARQVSTTSTAYGLSNTTVNTNEYALEYYASVLGARNIYFLSYGVRPHANILKRWGSSKVGGRISRYLRLCSVPTEKNTPYILSTAFLWLYL